jgi:hypothetical protein
VPSSIEEDGTAQAENAYIGPLTDPASQGFLGVYDKLARQRPNWVTLVDEDDGSAVFKLAVDDAEALAVAKAWLSTPNANEWMSDTGSPAPGSVRPERVRRSGLKAIHGYTHREYSMS